MDDLSRFCCLNPRCPDHGKRGCGNLSVRARYGPHQRRLLYCKSCKARFSERKGTPLFDARLPPEKVVAVLAHIATRAQAAFAEIRSTESEKKTPCLFRLSGLKKG